MGYERKLIALNPSCYNFYRPHSSYYIDFTEKIMRNAFYASSPTPKRLRAQAKSQIEKKNSSNWSITENLFLFYFLLQ